MTETTLNAFLEELGFIEKEAGLKSDVLKTLAKVRKGARGAERTYNDVGTKVFHAAGKVVPPDKLNKVTQTGTEILHKLYA